MTWDELEWTSQMPGYGRSMSYGLAISYGLTWWRIVFLNEKGCLRGDVTANYGKSNAKSLKADLRACAEALGIVEREEAT